jgi:hypothetical protein
MQRMLLIDRYVHLLFPNVVHIVGAAMNLFSSINNKVLVLDSLLETSLGNKRFTPTDSANKIISKMSENYTSYMRVFSLICDSLYAEYPGIEKSIFDNLGFILKPIPISKHTVKSPDGKTTMEIDAWLDTDYFIFLLKTKYLPAEYKLPTNKFNEHQHKQLDGYMKEAHILLELHIMKILFQLEVTPTDSASYDINVNFIKTRLINIGYDNFMKPGEISQNLFSNFIGMLSINIPILFDLHFSDVSLKLIELIMHKRVAMRNATNSVNVTQNQV